MAGAIYIYMIYKKKNKRRKGGITIINN